MRLIRIIQKRFAFWSHKSAKRVFQLLEMKTRPCQLDLSKMHALCSDCSGYDRTCQATGQILWLKLKSS